MRRTGKWRGVLCGAGALVSLSCAEPVAVALDPSAASDSDRQIMEALAQQPQLLACDPLPPDSVTQVVGPAGGVVAVGPHTLTIVAGALDSAVAITAVAPSESVRRVRFAPEGLTFRQPVSLTMSYAQCGLLGGLVPKRIAYTTDGLGLLELLLSLDDVFAQRVTAQLAHFSSYAVAW